MPRVGFEPTTPRASTEHSTGLSYRGMVAGEGIEPSTSPCKRGVLPLYQPADRGIGIEPMYDALQASAYPLGYPPNGVVGRTRTYEVR